MLFAFDGDGAAKAFDDGFDNCQAKAGAFDCGGAAVCEKRFKNMGQVAGGNATAVVLDVNDDLFFAVPADIQGENAVLGHGFERILQQVDDHHFEVDIVSDDFQIFIWEIGVYNDAVVFGLIVEQVEDFFDVVLAADRCRVVTGGIVCQTEQALGDFDTFNQLVVNQVQVFLFNRGSVCRDFIQQAFNNHPDGAEVVFHFMGDRGGQKAQ